MYPLWIIYEDSNAATLVSRVSILVIASLSAAVKRGTSFDGSICCLIISPLESTASLVP